MIKNVKAILFDLDGTLLPMNEDRFTNGYFELICKTLKPLGYEKDKLIQTIWQGTKEMVKNDGAKTNENVFWSVFKNIYGEERLKDKSIIDDFYINEFKETKSFCEKNELARQIIDLAKSKNLKIILATNPVFPKGGILTRLSFINLSQEDFDYISSYENSHYAKPNPKYFEEILCINNLKSNEVIFFGNSEIEDIEPAKSCGIESYLIGNFVNLKDKNSNLKILTYNEVLKLINDINT